MEPPQQPAATAAPQVAHTVEVDEEDFEELSHYSASFASSVRSHEWKHGRRYHSYQSGSYQFPNDEWEQARLDMVHHVVYRLLGDRLFLAPINPQGMRILDIGTGTGIWPIEMGDLYPSAQIVGNDLSPIQPQWVPQNVQFLVDDVEKDWVETQPYDYIHCRYMCASIRDWPRLVQQCYQNLKPGGWVEFQDFEGLPYSEDGSVTPENHLIKMLHHLGEACDKVGRTLNTGPFLKGWVEKAGFTRIEEQVFKLPIGTWPKDRRLKEMGAFMAVSFIEGVEGFTASPFLDILGWSKEDVAALNEKVREDVTRRDAHPIYNFYVVTAQKPA
ncbi:hypothetical protein VTN77DRAFT_2543 [Rasamsonia byssochlamydoides]|uniref:uncharacterized protein n=1 Tax=Rasamsonia byssochlamydoides TaxID=89139 RepID=UPI00374422DE